MKRWAVIGLLAACTTTETVGEVAQSVEGAGREVYEFVPPGTCVGPIWEPAPDPTEPPQEADGVYFEHEEDCEKAAMEGTEFYCYGFCVRNGVIIGGRSAVFCADEEPDVDAMVTTEDWLMMQLCYAAGGSMEGPACDPGGLCTIAGSWRETEPGVSVYTRD